MSVDGTDCQICEPWPFTKAKSPIWWSHKINKAALRYEVGLCIVSGDIVWLNGPYAAGSWNDEKIFRDCMIHYLDKDEQIEADSGYRGSDPEFVKSPSMALRQNEDADLKNRVRARHETVNKRLKQFKMLDGAYRHNIGYHNFVFRSIAVITQLSIEAGEPLFSVDYSNKLLIKDK